MPNYIPALVTVVVGCSLIGAGFFVAGAQANLGQGSRVTCLCLGALCMLFACISGVALFIQVRHWIKRRAETRAMDAVEMI